MLIDASTLRRRLAAGEKFDLIDVRDHADWQQATLPNAHHLNVYDYFIPDATEAGVQQMAASFLHAWRQLPRRPDAIPVFFEQQVGMRSPRGVWFCELTGERSMLLDGGLDAWRLAGGTVLPGQGISAVVSASRHLPLPVDFRRECTATRDEVIRADGVTTVILDARRPAEFDGSFVHPCCPRAGRIPGATLLFWEDMVQDGRFLPPEEIARRAQAAGLQPHQRIIAYCHRGARAATVTTALRLAGYTRLAVYVGSWHEWAEHEELPLQRGEPTDAGPQA
ncbi:sulfurtransferase [Musicola paradisiaca]|uniref:Rhodanese domain protein n=1 Tax=Musicola paradisiaca (strain Ech703) TaxID=579405 RepID=C6CCU6_MUSP7|nr:rhodanese-like domain-containing protein [Musicola paradisiaca]ACS84987.1 Rhodanese domain protein [Musicola paradisiaca Ech703]